MLTAARISACLRRHMRAPVRRLVAHEAVQFSAEERAQYEGLAAEEAGGDSYMHVLAKLLRLRMACNHPRLQQCRAALQPQPALALAAQASTELGSMPMMCAEDPVLSCEGHTEVMTALCHARNPVVSIRVKICALRWA